MKFVKMFLFVILCGVLLMNQMPASVSAQQTPAATEPAGMSMEQPDAATMNLLDGVRAATAKYRDLNVAKAAGYDKFLTCFRHGDNMAMGQHFVNGKLAGDDVLDPKQPEALVYEPQADGSMVLVAFEYLVFDKTWDPNHTGRPAPMIYGQPLQLLTNIPNTPPVWGLHLWLYSYNPEGLFASFNPTVSCPAGEDSIDMSKL
jgi:hypothetical protein